MRRRSFREKPKAIPAPMTGSGPGTESVGVLGTVWVMVSLKLKTPLSFTPFTFSEEMKSTVVGGVVKLIGPPTVICPAGGGVWLAVRLRLSLGLLALRVFVQAGTPGPITEEVAEVLTSWIALGLPGPATVMV